MKVFVYQLDISWTISIIQTFVFQIKQSVPASEFSVKEKERLITVHSSFQTKVSASYEIKIKTNKMTLLIVNLLLAATSMMMMQTFSNAKLLSSEVSKLGLFSNDSTQGGGGGFSRQLGKRNHS